MKNKLDPRQYNPYSLETPSGNLIFTQELTSFNCYLSENPTGNFNYTGNVLINNGQVLYSNESNNIGGLNNSIFNSINSFATGSNNSIVGSDNSSISGDHNMILGGSDNQVSDADYAGVLFGRNVIAQHTGSAVLGDSDNLRQKSTKEVYSLCVDFKSGLFVENDFYLNSDAYLTGNTYISNGDFYIDELSSGLASGDFQFLGAAYHTGSPLQNLQNIKDHSGFLKSFTTGISGVLSDSISHSSGEFDSKLGSTGSNLIAINNSTSGAIKTESDVSFSFCIKTTGTQTVNGIKNFNDEVLFNDYITGNDASFTGNFSLGDGRSVPTSFNSLGQSGQLSFDENYFYVCTGFSSWARILITGW